MNAAAPGAAVRAAAAETIRAVRFDGASLKAVLPQTLASLADARDRALCEALCFESLRWALRYERILDRLLQRPLPPAARDVHALLLAGLAQLDAMRLAPYAAISATAEAARLRRQPRHVGLINAVLRRFERERASIEAMLDADPIARHSHPPWLAQAFERDWGAGAAALLDAGNRAAPTWLRANSRRVSRDALRVQLAASGIETGLALHAPDALQLLQRAAPASLPGWEAGLMSVQDVAAQLSVDALQPRRGQRVLDACAAPGGKLAHIAERQSELSFLLGIELDSKRLGRIEQNLQRLGLAASLRCADATAPQTWWDGKPFDAILLDAPCSGTGVIRRQPDIRLHRSAADVAALVQLQARLLDALWPLLASGGRLVYATCSVLKDENERQTDAFLARTPDAVALALPEHFGRASGSGRQRFPGEDDGDGFYHATFVRRG